jgi:hypothetical protein
MVLVSPWISGGEAVRLLADRAGCDPTVAWEALKDAYQAGEVEGRARGREAARQRFEEDRGFWTAADEYAWLTRCQVSNVTDQFLEFLDETREFRRKDVQALTHSVREGATDGSAAAAPAKTPVSPLAGKRQKTSRESRMTAALIAMHDEGLDIWNSEPEQLAADARKRADIDKIGGSRSVYNRAIKAAREQRPQR